MKHNSNIPEVLPIYKNKYVISIESCRSAEIKVTSTRQGNIMIVFINNEY